MSNAFVNFSVNKGVIKPMHAVNNGPLPPNVRGTSNFDVYKESGIPFARNHDAAFHASYGGEHTVDVHRIFKNFDADENDPASYIFGPTDICVKSTIDSGTKVYYRLGAAIEHGLRWGTYPPKDFEKWARICEHIIAHYTEGWADGFNYDIEYWEIWNEPDCINPDGSNPCWQGSSELFIEFYEVIAKYLKNRFPNLKIGGPAFMSPWRDDFKRGFLNNVKANNVPLDFYSYHCYAKTPKGIYEAAVEADEALKEAGLEGTETILNEWNYVKGWMNDDWKASVDAWKGLKGSSFITATMSLCQYGPVDMLMFYEARPCIMCSLFETDRPWVALKGYYPFKMFNELYKLGGSVEASSDCEDVFVVAAKDENKAALLLTYFEDETDVLSKEINIKLSDSEFSKNVTVKYYLLDNTHDAELVREEHCEKLEDLKIELQLYSSYLIVLEK